jgi:hypothetical protein
VVSAATGAPDIESVRSLRLTRLRTTEATAGSRYEIRAAHVRHRVCVLERPERFVGRDEHQWLCVRDRKVEREGRSPGTARSSGSVTVQSWSKAPRSSRWVGKESGFRRVPFGSLGRGHIQRWSDRTFFLMLGGPPTLLSPAERSYPRPVRRCRENLAPASTTTGPLPGLL